MPTPRTPLGEINTNKVRRQPVSPFLRGFIEKSRVAGQSATSLSRELDIPRKTVIRTLELNPQRINGETRARSGRPRISSSTDVRNILRLVRATPRITYAKIREALLKTFSDDTIGRILKEHGIANWRAKRRPLLKADVVKKRLKWAKEHVDWTSEQWEACIWSDECSLERASGGRRVWVFRTPKQKWDKEMIEPYKKGKDITIMI